MNAYEKKTRGKISREELRWLMNEETFLTAQRALEIGLLDEIMEDPNEKKAVNTTRLTVTNAFRIAILDMSIKYQPIDRPLVVLKKHIEQVDI